MFEQRILDSEIIHICVYCVNAQVCVCVVYTHMFACVWGGVRVDGCGYACTWGPSVMSPIITHLY